jgi:hypothetical protein
MDDTRREGRKASFLSLEVDIDTINNYLILILSSREVVVAF